MLSKIALAIGRPPRQNDDHDQRRRGRQRRAGALRRQKPPRMHGLWRFSGASAPTQLGAQLSSQPAPIVRGMHFFAVSASPRSTSMPAVDDAVRRGLKGCSSAPTANNRGTFTFTAPMISRTATKSYSGCGRAIVRGRAAARSLRGCGAGGRRSTW